MEEKAEKRDVRNKKEKTKKMFEDEGPLTGPQAAPTKWRVVVIEIVKLKRTRSFPVISRMMRSVLLISSPRRPRS